MINDIALSVEVNARRQRRQTALDITTGVNKEILKSAGVKQYLELCPC